MSKDSKTDPFQQVRLQTLTILLAIREHGSAKVAAEKLRINGSVITRQIKELEDKLGVVLFERHSRGMDLTPAGKAYAKSAARVVAELDHARSRINRLESEPKGRVRVHTSEVLVDDYLLPVIDSLIKDYQHISVDAVIGSADQARESLLNHTVDFATIFGVKDHDDIEVVRAVKYPLIAVVHHEHPLASAGEMTPVELLKVGVPIALPPRPYATRLIFESLLARAVPELRLEDYVAFTINSFERLKRFAMLGKAIAILPELSASAELKRGTLVAVRLKGAEQSARSFGLCRHRKHPFSVAARHVFERFDRAFSELTSHVD